MHPGASQPEARISTFRSSDRAQYSAARANLKIVTKKAKAAYKRKIKKHFHNNNMQQV